MSGLVSTIIPVFNRPTMLHEAIDSVLAQTYRPIEVIVVDDGSSDETGEVADALVARHSEVRVIHQRNGGPGLAREAGRLLARGTYIQHLDSDDLLMPRKFELQVTALEVSPQSGVAYGWTRFRRTNGMVEPQAWKRSGERIETMFPAMLTSRWWDTPTPLYRAAVTSAAGPWTDLRVEEDWEYDCRIASLGVRLAYVDDWVCEIRGRGAPYIAPMFLRDRARAHLLMLRHARNAGLENESPEMQFFARDLFHLARQCGIVDLAEESRQLIAAARSISNARDLRAYALAGRTIGFGRVARGARWFERLRGHIRQA